MRRHQRYYRRDSSFSCAFEEFDAVKTYNDLRKVNQGVGSVYDDKKGVFHDKVLVPLHNQGTYNKLDKFVTKRPNEFNRLRMAMFLDLWKHSRASGTFGDFLRRGRVRAYRGVMKGENLRGRSWTLERRIAEAFSKHGARIGFRGVPSDGGQVLEREIPLDNVLAYSNQQDEKEIVLKVPM